MTRKLIEFNKNTQICIYISTFDGLVVRFKLTDNQHIIINAILPFKGLHLSKLRKKKILKMLEENNL